MSQSSRTVVVLGGSYGGASAASFLSKRIPEGWRIILIERNSHANHVYVLPRFAVVSGHEHKAFIPYTTLYGPCPTENLVLHAKVTKLERHSVTISRSFPQFGLTNVISFDYCIYALGSRLPAPIDLWGETEESHEENVDVLGDVESESTNDKISAKRTQERIGSKEEGVAWLRQAYKKIKTLDDVLIVGGGALGIQFATDIKDLYPEKRVTLLHSRAKLLPRFDPLMHNEVCRALEDLGVEVLLSTRLDLASLSEHGKQAPNGRLQHVVRTLGGRTITADLVLLCTGQTPNTGLMKDFAPETIDDSTGYAKVNRAMQLIPVPAARAEADEITDKLNKLELDDADTIQDSPYSHIFVVGDAADGFGAIKAGHNAYFQAEVACKNILKLIERHSNSEASESTELEYYRPPQPMIKLSLGLSKAVYQIDGLVGLKEDQNEDLDAPLIWKYFGADPEAAGGMMR